MNIRVPVRLAMLALTCTVVVALAGTVRAEPSAIAVIDTSIIMRDSAAAKSIKAQVDQQVKSFQQWGKTNQDKLEAEGAALEKQRTVLSRDQLAQKETDLRKKFSDFQQDARQRDRKIQQAATNAQQELIKMLNVVVSDIAKKQSISLVLPKEATVYTGSTKDITDETLRALNAKLPSVKLAVAP